MVSHDALALILAAGGLFVILFVWALTNVSDTDSRAARKRKNGSDQ